MPFPGWTPAASLEAERALRGLSRLKVVVGRSRTFLTLTSPRSASAYRADINDLGLVRAFSILESYLSARGDTIIRRELPVPTNPSKLVSYAHLELLASLRGSFERGPVRLWQKGLDVDLNKYPRRAEVDDLRELRNLVTHALGYVRPGGTALKPSLKARLAKITSDPKTFVGRLPVTDDDVDDSIALTREFVLWIDTQRP